MKKMLFALVLLVGNTAIYSQSISNPMFKNGDKINVLLTEHSESYYIHKIKKGQSLYALSKTFNVTLRDLYKLNFLQEGGTISIGQQIKIPINEDYLFKGSSLEGLVIEHFVPVYYKTMSKDNLFRISRVYFNQPTKDLVLRNNLKNDNLALGQDILIGWLPIDNFISSGNKEEFEEEIEESNSVASTQEITSNDSTKEEDQDALIIPELTDASDEYPQGFNLSLLGVLTYSKSMQEIKKLEVANWNNSMPDNGNVYALHKSAILNSYIEMYNPILKRTVRAKVIGRIPYGAYTNDVSLVLSPRAAKELGALDNRFKVEVNALIRVNENS